MKNLHGILLMGAMAVSVICAQSKTYDGYTFVFGGRNLNLYDMDKKVVNKWTVQNTIQACADLLRDSSVIVPFLASGSGFTKLAVPHGHFQILNWKGEITWDYTYASSSYTPHHDIEPVYRTDDPREKPTFLVPCYTSWGDKIVEIRPTGKTTAEVIWEWSASDHLCESGCTDKSDLLDKNKGGSASFNKTSDAMHVNNVSYNRKLDQIVISCKGYNELLIIDHSTTTAEAKTSSGGTSGKGGSILYRWGNPANYGISGAKKVLSGQHHCCWVPDTMPGTKHSIPGGGNFMVIDNGNRRALEIENPFKNGIYTRSSGKAYDPATFLWSYKPSGLAGNEGSIQKLPNGNYLICTGGIDMGFGWGGRDGDQASVGTVEAAFPGSGSGKVYEVTPSGSSSGTIVWELSGFGTSTEGYRYAYEYLNGGKTPVKKSAPAHPDLNPLRFGTIVSNGMVQITTDIGLNNASMTLYALSGKEIIKMSGGNNVRQWYIGSIPDGTYLVKFTCGGKMTAGKIMIQNG
ncbi:MAG: aryl-sulfate sulfotransferase [Chitinispirillaceae bacterium]|nr:aryl-sulfate sulfotransferase [Chitinispirillaceae bacterium]